MANTDQMTQEQFATLKGSIDDLKARLDRMDDRISALPDKAAIYVATIAIHGIIWATILGTLVALRTLGVF